MSSQATGPSADASERLSRAAGEDDPTAIRLLQEAIELDPTLGDAYLALARIYYKHAWFNAELHLWQRRLAVDSNDPDAHERIGWIFWFTGRAEDALPQLKRSIDLRPTGRWGHFYMGNANLILGRYPDAELAYRAALNTYPDHSSAHAGLAWTLFAAGSDAEANAHCDGMRASTLDGDRYEVKMADLELFSGNADVAADLARRAAPEDPSGWLGRYWPRGIAASTILAAAILDRDRAAADEALETSASVDRARITRGDEGYVPRYDLAAVCALRGARDEACHWLGEAIAMGWWFPDLARRDPLLRSLRDHAPFTALLNQRPAARRHVESELGSA
ncbi:MAG: eukaryotic-like serine/threonine-protein kinase [Chloroflexota bacterium]|nr:eukaryotic-like serine/threonine-protein kinase [Chloroflexota bacterium]